MKKSFPILLCAVLVVTGAGYGHSRENTVAVALPQELIAQIHFVGGEQISADTNSSAFTNLWCSPEAQALRGQTLDKLAHAPYEWFKSTLPVGAGDGSAQFRLLLDDLLQSEWFLDVRAATKDRKSVV